MDEDRAGQRGRLGAEIQFAWTGAVEAAHGRGEGRVGVLSLVLLVLLVWMVVVVVVGMRVRCWWLASRVV